MDDKSSGIDFDRQVFVQPQSSMTRPASHAPGAIFALVIIAAVAFLAYKFMPQISQGFSAGSDSSTAHVDNRLTAIEGRLEKLEAARSSAANRKEQPSVPAEPASKPVAKTVYQVSPPARQPASSGPKPTQGPDPAVSQRISSLQQGIGDLQNGQAADREAWQATTDRLSDMAGQVGTQSVDIMRSQDEINELLARTEMKAIPFELIRRTNPLQVGPVSLILKSSNPKTQRYTLCVYVQPSCIELKDRTRYEVVQFVVSRNTAPLKVIATKIIKDEILGYLEVPKAQN
jgi:hypothetical protein